jgi:hypothetical protein
MPEAPPPLERFHLKHKGKLIGPFSRNLIEGFAMGGVFPLDAMVIPFGTQDKVRLGSLMSFPPPLGTQKPKGLRRYPAHLFVIGGAVTIVLAAAGWAAFQPSEKEPEYVSRPYKHPALSPQMAKRPSVRNGSSTTSQKSVPLPAGKDPLSEPSLSRTLCDAQGRIFRLSVEDYQRLFPLSESLRTVSLQYLDEGRRLDDLKREIATKRELLFRDDQGAIDRFNAQVQLFNRDSMKLKSDWDNFHAATQQLDSEVHRVGILAY